MLMIPPISDKFVFEAPQNADPVKSAQRSNRRRLAVFLFVFSVTLVPGLVWNLQRPAEYRATARMQVTTGSVASRAETPSAGAVDVEPSAQRNNLLSQAQILTSRPFLDEVLNRLLKEDQTGELLRADAALDLPGIVSVSPIPGTDILELQAIGAPPQLMAKVVNTVIATYREKLFAGHSDASRDAIVNLRDEVARLGVSITRKRAELAAFRERNGVVSSERTENQALAQIKGLSDSLNKANEDAAKADARLRALRESAASGRSPVFSRDNPTLAAIEQRISLTREDLRDMERVYTPDFMRMDPTARALRARLAELEQQLSASKLNSQQAALVAAEEDAAGARANVERLRHQIDSERRAAQVFTGRFHEAQSLEEDLTRLETARRSSGERLAKLEASENGRLPSFTLIESASVPQSTWRPDYLRDGLINLGASFLLGLLAMGFVELFNRKPTSSRGASGALVVPQYWMGNGVTFDAAPPLNELPRNWAQPAVPPLLARTPSPRELSQEEVKELLAAANGEGRLICGLLLLGLTVDEVRALNWEDVDPDTSTLRVRGVSERVLTLPQWLAQALQDGCAISPNHGTTTPDKTDSPLFCNALRQPLSASDIAVRVTCSALDAGLDTPASVAPEALRHTFIANLIHQNIRFSDLGSMVGQMSAKELEVYATIATGSKKVCGSDVDPIMPAVRAL